MKSTILISTFFAVIVLTACNKIDKGNSNLMSDSTNIDTLALIPETITYFNIPADQSLVISNPITYDVLIKNYDTTDEWAIECLSKTKSDLLINSIFQAVYKSRLVAWDYISLTPLTIDQVKEIEKTSKRKQIGKIQFVENWYFNEDKLQMIKKVDEITFGYELLSVDGEIRGFKAAFKVYLSDSSKNVVQIP